MQSPSVPVSSQELEMVKNVLARLEAQGTPIHPGMWNSQTVPGAMTDGSKRRCEPSDFPSSDDDLFTGDFSERGSASFELIPAGSMEQPVKKQTPVTPQTQIKKPELPDGVSSVTQWGCTVCELPKVKDDAPTYAEIGSMDKYKDYRSWIFSQGKSKGPRAIDLRNYLIAAGIFDERGDVLIPGSTEVRRFRQ